MNKIIKPIKVIFVLPTLQAGGAERVVSFVAQGINRDIFNVELLVTGHKQKDSYELDNIKITYLNKEKVRFAMPFLILHFIRNNSDIVFSSLSHLNMVISLISIVFPKRIFIARETFIRSETSGYKTTNVKKAKNIYQLIESISFKLFDYIICQSTDMFYDTKNEFNIKEKKLKILGNPITDEFTLKRSKANYDKSYNFITVGRLSSVKGHQRILETLSKFNKPFTYTIIGEGPLKKLVFEKAKTLNVFNKIKYVPFTKNVSHYLKKADFFIQGSYTEGFPNALLESCAVGTPVIAFEARGGTKEIIENGVNGFLVQTEEDLLARLNNLPNFDPKSVSESVYKKFDKIIILKEYEDFFMEIVKK